jgi:hypothetical protein
MRKVFEHPAAHEVGRLESILNSEGVPTVIKNQNVSSLMGEVPFAAAYPELWVLDDGDYEKALALLRDYHTRITSVLGPDWTCAKCGEAVPSSFGSCWNCGHAPLARPDATVA